MQKTSPNSPPDSSSNSQPSSAISALLSKKKTYKRLCAGLAVAALVAVGARIVQVEFFSSLDPKTSKASVSKMYADLADGKVAKMSVIASYLSQAYGIELKDGTRYDTTGPRLDASDAREFQAKGVEVVFEPPKTDYSALPNYLLIGILISAMLLSVGQSIGISFTRKDKKSSTRFADVAGNTEAKGALEQVVQYLKDPLMFEKLGAKFPKGLIMDGPPGTGKTLLVRAAAGEANAHFMHCSGSDFQSMFVGMSSVKVRAFFARARRNAPCVVFIDEIDAIGGKRLTEGTSVAREMSSTLNQLLVQMDGFVANSGVIVVAATNRIELLDPALLRSGRFDRQIHLQLPTVHEREDILKIHGKSLMTDAFDFASIARASIGMSGADLENLLNQAALIAVSERAACVTTQHALLARDRMLMGEARYAHAKGFDERTRRILAAHEAGHAIVAMVCGSDPVSRVSIIPRGQSLGQTVMTPSSERVIHERSFLLNQVRLLLGGRAAELLVEQTQTAGVVDDLSRASALCMQMVCRFGMSNSLLFINESSSDSLRFTAEKEAEQIMASCMLDAQTIIEQNRPVLDLMIAELLATEEISELRMKELSKLCRISSGEGCNRPAD